MSNFFKVTLLVLFTLHLQLVGMESLEKTLTQINQVLSYEEWKEAANDKEALDKWRAEQPPELPDEFGLLLIACKQGNSESVNFLLTRYPSFLNLRDLEGNTPLLVACRFGQKELAVTLLSRGATLSGADFLDVCRARKHLPENPFEGILEILMSNETYVQEAIKEAFLKNDRDSLDFLILYGVNQDLITGSTITPFNVMDHDKQLQIWQMLDVALTKQTNWLHHHSAHLGRIPRYLALRNRNFVDQHGRSLLHVACMHGNVQLAKNLIEMGYDVNASDESGWTPLHLAARYGQRAVVELLLECGVNQELIDRDNKWKAMHWAAWAGFDQIVRLLNKNTALSFNERRQLYNIGGHLTRTFSEILTAVRLGKTKEVKTMFNLEHKDITDAHGRTLLHGACAVGNVELVKFFIEQGLHKNARDESGMTPLHVAARYGYGDIVAMLKAAGADETMYDNGNRLAKDWATWASVVLRGQLNVDSALEIEGDDLFDAYLLSVEERKKMRLLDAAKKGDMAALTLHFTEKDRDIKDENGKTMLYLATVYGHRAVVEFLIDHGVNINNDDVWGMTPLHAAARYGMPEITALLLKKGAALGSFDNNFWTPLHWASWLGNYAVVEMLLAAGCDSNTKIFDNDTPLHIACVGGHAKIVRLLLKKGANIDAQGRLGWTPLGEACFTASESSVWGLIELGASLGSLKDSIDHSTTPVGMLFASRYCLIPVAPYIDGWLKGRKRILEYLMSKGVDSTWALHSACSLANALRDCTKNMLLVSFLLHKGANHNLKDSRKKMPFSYYPGIDQVLFDYFFEKRKEHNFLADFGTTLLHRAAGMGKEDCVLQLLQEGFDSNIKDHQGATPLHEALEDSIAELLIEKGALVDAKNNQGRTPLHLAVISDSVERVQMFLNNKAMINARDASGKTPLFLAKSVEMLECLLNNGASLEEKDNEGKTVFYRACMDHQEIDGFERMMYLLNKGANTSITDKDGTPLVHVLCAKNWYHIAKLIIKKNPALIMEKNPNNGRMLIHIARDCDFLKRLLAAGVPVDVQDKQGKTALHLLFEEIMLGGQNEVSLYWTLAEILLDNNADPKQYCRDQQGKTILWYAWEQRMKCVERLLSAGFDLNLPLSNGVTLFHHFCLHNEIHNVKVLMGHGADVHARDAFGRTPLLCVPIVSLPNSLDSRNLVKFLLDAGADINAKDNEGNSLLSLAVAKGDVEMVKVLLDRGADINWTDINGRTLLHRVSSTIFRRHVDTCEYNCADEMVRLLLEKGLVIDIRDGQGFTAFHRACRSGNKMLAKMLLKLGANINTVSYDGSTPLYLARQWEIGGYLILQGADRTMGKI